METTTLPSRVRAALRALMPALRARLFGRALLIIAGAAFGVCWSATAALAWVMPPSGPLQAHTALAASFAANLLCLAVLLGLLPGRPPLYLPLFRGERTTARPPDGNAWASFSAWVGSIVVAAAAFAGLACAPFHHESVRTFLVLWVLFAGQAALVTGGYALISLALPAAFSRLLVLLLMSICVTALFWSKPAIERLPKSLRADAGQTLDPAQLVMSLSPPAAVASAWYQNSDAARSQSEGRFGLIHGPKTYQVWLGSYQAISYPRILPSKDDTGRQGLGLAAALLLCGLPVLVVCELVRATRPEPRD